MPPPPVPVPDHEHRLVLGLPPDGLDHLDIGYRIWGWRVQPHAPLLHVFCCSPVGRLAVILEGPPGVRAFVPDPRVPWAVVLALRAELEAERTYAEACWAADIVRLGWVSVEVVPDAVVVTVYGGTASAYDVTVEVLGVSSATLEAGIEDVWLVAVESGEREVQMRLGPMLWRSR